ncbi:MAG: hypothetical protein PHQ60_01960 [Sideroxydans sp.]|nr:hypothetical protein [Sideroxydans sp.]MDD5056607.1 hypothetical protein [Sideroxydans sp.]
MANKPKMDKRSLYKAWIIYLYVTGQDNAYEAYKAIYGSSHIQENNESDIDYVSRCSEQDYWDGEQGAAVYQEVFDALEAISELPDAATVPVAA